MINMRKLQIQRFRVQLPPTDDNKNQLPAPEPSFSSHLRFSYKCTYCHQEHEMFTRSKGVYTEFDLLTAIQTTFDFAHKKCDHGKKASQSKTA
jgi:hypothetical protein